MKLLMVFALVAALVVGAFASAATAVVPMGAAQAQELGALPRINLKRLRSKAKRKVSLKCYGGEQVCLHNDVARCHRKSRSDEGSCPIEWLWYDSEGNFHLYCEGSANGTQRPGGFIKVSLSYGCTRVD